MPAAQPLMILGYCGFVLRAVGKGLHSSSAFWVMVTSHFVLVILTLLDRFKTA